MNDELPRGVNGDECGVDWEAAIGDNAVDDGIEGNGGVSFNGGAGGTI
jgi:hypothetical protein